MEEALAYRKRLNQRIRQFRKEAEENAKLEQELFGDVKEPAATVSDNGRESAKKRARNETPNGKAKKRRAMFLQMTWMLFTILGLGLTHTSITGTAQAKKRKDKQARKGKET